MDLLKTQRALVTGAQRGIGRAIAEAYAGQAAALILHAEPSFENDLNQVMPSPLALLQPVCMRPGTFLCDPARGPASPQV